MSRGWGFKGEGGEPPPPWVAAPQSYPTKGIYRSEATFLVTAPVFADHRIGGSLRGGRAPLIDGVQILLALLRTKTTLALPLTFDQKIRAKIVLKTEQVSPNGEFLAPSDPLSSSRNGSGDRKALLY